MKKIRGILICSFIIMTFGNIIFLTAEEEKPLKTGITNLDWVKVDYQSLNENYSNFEFTIDYDITNPNEENVTFTFPSSGYGFKANMTAQFRDRKLEMHDYTSFVGLTFTRYENFTSGITSKIISYRIGIKKQGITDLPDGTYYLWVKSYNVDETIVLANITKLSIKNGNPIIIYNNNETTIGLNFPIYFLISNLFIFFGMSFLKKKNLRDL